MGRRDPVRAPCHLRVRNACPWARIPSAGGRCPGHGGPRSALWRSRAEAPSRGRVGAAGFCKILSPVWGGALCRGETLLDVGRRGRGTENALDAPAQKGFREPCRPSSSRGWAGRAPWRAAGRDATSQAAPRCSDPGEAHPDPAIPLGEGLPRPERLFKQGTVWSPAGLTTARGSCRSR